MTAYDNVLAALSACGSSKRGDNWSCPGPLHVNGDRKPSLHVDFREGRVLLNCFAGCDTRDIVSALGLEMKDLFGERREVARYIYRDVNGCELFAKHRYEPKDFLVFHKEGDGWEPKIGNAQPVLYRLPELNAAVAAGQTVYIVEGEKDVDAMAAKGYAATCNYEGAGKWRDSYAFWFAGADVVIIADRDEPGYQHARKVRESLRGKARSVRIVQAAVPRPKADISDHFEAGYGIEDLMPLAGAFKPCSLTGLVSSGVTEPQRLADGMLYRGGLHCIAGAPDSGKTTIALHWAAKLLSEGRTVAFFDEEGGPEIVAEKLISLGAEISSMNNLVYVPFPGKMWDDNDVTGLTEFLDDVSPEMVLWDSSAAFLARAGLDENSAPAVTSWWARVLTPLARDLHAAVVVIDHDTKASEQSRYARGSGAKLAALDVQYKVEIKKPFARDQNGLLRLFVSKDRRGYLHRNWLVEANTLGGNIDLIFRHESEEALTDTWPPVKRKIYGVLTAEYQTNDQIRKRIEEFFPEEQAPARETVSKYLNELLWERRAERSGSETRASWKKGHASL